MCPGDGRLAKGLFVGAVLGGIGGFVIASRRHRVGTALEAGDASQVAAGQGPLPSPGAAALPRGAGAFPLNGTDARQGVASKLDEGNR